MPVTTTMLTSAVAVQVRLLHSTEVATVKTEMKAKKGDLLQTMVMMPDYSLKVEPSFPGRHNPALAQPTQARLPCSCYTNTACSTQRCVYSHGCCAAMAKVQHTRH